MNLPETNHSGSVQGCFETEVFRPVYQRNNKRGGLKNLRCFPSCSLTEHRTRGFCGRSVVVTFRHTQALSNLRAFCEFQQEPFEADSCSHAVDLTQIRTKSDPLKPLIEGRLAWRNKDGCTEFEFNAERRGWHYAWGSNKHKCDTKHRLVCKLYDASTMSFISQCASPEFVLFCRRRRRFNIEPSSSPLATPSLFDQALANVPERKRKQQLETKLHQGIDLLRLEKKVRISPSNSSSASDSNEDGDDGDDVHEATCALLALNQV